MSAPAGFTLVETLIALVLSTIVILLVSSTFLVQNNYYGSQMQRAGAQDNARAATELLAREIRSTMEGGVVVAGEGTLAIRTPIVLGIICDRQGGSQDAHIHTEGSVLDDPWEVSRASPSETRPQALELCVRLLELHQARRAAGAEDDANHRAKDEAACRRACARPTGQTLTAPYRNFTRSRIWAISSGQ